MLSLIEERYARSLYELGCEDKNSKELLEELLAVDKIFAENPEFLKLLSSPVVAFSEKSQLISNVFGGKLSPYVENFLLLMAERGRIAKFPGACEAYKEMYYEDNGICEAHVTSAVELSEDARTRLAEKLGKLTGKNVILTCSVDIGLIGGLVVKIGNEQIDSSVRTRLDELSQQMKQIIA